MLITSGRLSVREFPSQCLTGFTTFSHYDTEGIPYNSVDFSYKLRNELYTCSYLV